MIRNEPGDNTQESSEMFMTQSTGDAFEITNRSEHMQLHAERATVERRSIQGRVALVTRRVVSKKQMIEIDVLHEELVIEYIDGDNSVLEPKSEEPLVILLHAEEVHISKSVHVREKIFVGKRRVTSTCRFDTHVRHETLELINLTGEAPEAFTA